MNSTKTDAIGTNRLVSTFSIVAFDPITEDLGVSVQSRYFSVGSVVPWAAAGVGAIATQAFLNVSYGPRGLKLLKKGLAIHEVIEKLVATDKDRAFRQLGIIDAKGNATAYTGEKCLPWAGSKIGKNYAAQGNILASEEVVMSMGKRFEKTKGDLADKLVAALEGGEEAGGDVRGKQSAALLVVRKKKGRAGYGDRLIDIRVEDHANPIEELKRLLNLDRAYRLVDEADQIFTAGNPQKAIATIKRAVQLNPDIDDAWVDLGIIYSKTGKKKEAKTAFEKAISLNPRMEKIIDQLLKRSQVSQ